MTKTFHLLRRWLLPAAATALLGACANIAPSPLSPAADSSASADSPSPSAAASHGIDRATANDLSTDPLVAWNAIGNPPMTTSPHLVVASPETGPATEAPLDPLEPERSIDLTSAAAETDLWVRVRRGFAMPDLDNDQVRAREQFYAAKPDYVRRMTERGGRYLFHILEEVERRGMPSEIALLPFIESAFNPQAMSVAAAAGMWQFVPATGRDYDLTQNVFRDDRRDVLASTRAALDYLERLHEMFGDWHLALAAYNWGEGSVSKAIARNEKNGDPTDYWSLRMPAETRDYVPKLQAMKNIVANPESFGLALPELRNHPYFLSVPIRRDVDVDLAARLAGIPLEEFRLLNPQMNKPVILAAGTPQLLLPYDNAADFVRRLGEHKGPLASWTAWVAPQTMNPAAVARQVGMSEARLREVNHIPPRMLVKAGSTLLVARDAQVDDDVSGDVADNATMALAPDAPPLKRVAFRVGKGGDSVGAVARRYRVSESQVAGWNGCASQASFKPGATVVVFVQPSRSAATRNAAKASPAAAPPVRAVAATPSTAAKTLSAAAGRTAATGVRPAASAAAAAASRAKTAAAPGLKTSSATAAGTTAASARVASPRGGITRVASGG